MSHLEFMGHVLSARGIGPADVKVKAVVDACELTNAAEVRTFLGLVNFSLRFYWGKEREQTVNAIQTVSLHSYSEEWQ